MLVRICAIIMVFAANASASESIQQRNFMGQIQHGKIQTYSFISSSVKTQNNCSILCAIIVCIHISRPLFSDDFVSVSFSRCRAPKCSVPRATTLFFVCLHTLHHCEFNGIFPHFSILYTFAICPTFLCWLLCTYGTRAREVSAIRWQRDGMRACLSSSQTLVNVKYVFK